MPIHIRDLENLPQSIIKEFQDHGHWVVSKTQNRFSAMPIDQAHEQSHLVVKGSSDAVGLTENPAAFRKWMIAGPEQARLMEEFVTPYSPDIAEKHYHHEECFSTQNLFKQQVLSLIQTIKDMGSPFLKTSPELLNLDLQNVMDDSVSETVHSVEALGKDQYKKYRKTVILDCTHSIHNPIKRNALSLFRCPASKLKTKQAKQISVLKDNVSLFSRLNIVAKHREGDMARLKKV